MSCVAIIWNFACFTASFFKEKESSQKRKQKRKVRVNILRTINALRVSKNRVVKSLKLSALCDRVLLERLTIVISEKKNACFQNRNSFARMFENVARHKLRLIELIYDFKINYILLKCAWQTLWIWSVVFARVLLIHDISVVLACLVIY